MQNSPFSSLVMDVAIVSTHYAYPQRWPGRVDVGGWLHSEPPRSTWLFNEVCLPVRLSPIALLVGLNVGLR